MFGCDNQQPTNSEQATTSANKKQTNNTVMKFFCAVMLVGILASCSHGPANPTDMLAKVNFNKIAGEMDMRREEKRKETRRDETRQDKRVWSVWCMLCGLCAQVHDFHLLFLHVMVLVPLTFRNVSSFFCFSRQFQALFHMLSNVNMWESALNCCEKQETIHTLWKVNGLFCDIASSPSLHLRSCRLMPAGAIDKSSHLAAGSLRSCLQESLS